MEVIDHLCQLADQWLSLVLAAKKKKKMADVKQVSKKGERQDKLI